MCGRFTLRTNPREFADILKVARSFDFDWRPAYNIAPTQTIICVRDTPGREFFPARWGLIPSWAKDPSIGNQCINARSETLEVKPAFRSAFKKRRCVVLADGYYEWQTVTHGQKVVKRPHYITLTSGNLIAFAGLWETWESPDGVIESAAICTTTANDRLAVFHHRMPVILPLHEMDYWLDPQATDPDELKSLLTSRPSDQLQAWEVAKDVGNVRNQGPDLVKPLQRPKTLF